MKKAIIVGSGFGGLALAIRLQAHGINVTLIEKNSRVGGHASQFTKNGYTFDMGPSLITAPELIDELFQIAGQKRQDYLELIPLNPFYRVYFADNTHFDYCGDTQRMKDEMNRFSSRDAKVYERFMASCKKIYDAVMTEGLGSEPFMTLKSLLKFLPRALRLGAVRSTYGYAKKYFKHPVHRFLFSFHPLFLGGNPFRSPAVYLMIPYLEKTGGVLFARGGMYTLVQALEKLFIKLGGELILNQSVEEIIIENNRATGIIKNSSQMRADMVISNADVLYTYQTLIKSGHKHHWNTRRIKNTDVSMSAFLIYLGIKKKYPQLLHHTLILSHRYKELVRDIFDHNVLPDDFSMYLHTPSKTDPAMAPEGCESLYILIPVTNLDADIDWSERKDDYTKKVLNFLENKFGLSALQEHIEVLETFTPDDFMEQRKSTKGSPWGIEPKLTQTAYFRPHNRSEDFKGLYFVGAGTHPGAGIPGVLLSAKATEKAIMDNYND
jgi:phytoene desaturase